MGKSSVLAASAAATAVSFCLYHVRTAGAASATWQGNVNSSWAVNNNWAPNARPDGVGDMATFTGTPPAPPASRAITIDSGPAGFTVGGILSSPTANFTSISAGTSGSRLILDNTGTDDALLLANGAAPTEIFAPLTFNDNVNAQIDDVTSSWGYSLRGPVDGPGGLTKNGNGGLQLDQGFGGSGGAKTYTGPTLVNAGLLRISNIAYPSATSSMTVKSGAQLELTFSGVYTFGPNTLTIGGPGLPGSSSLARGALRIGTGDIVTVNNDIHLTSSTTFHVVGSANPTLGTLTLPGDISGGADVQLTLSSEGGITLGGANTYGGGNLIAGPLTLSGPDATLGTGDVTFQGTSSLNVLTIGGDVTDGIADTATVLLTGRGFNNTADGNHVFLAAGVNETVNQILLGIDQRPAFPGTWGSSASPAEFKNDEYFSGTGVFTVLVPEPGAAAAAVVLVPALLAASRRRWRRT